ncbi:MAG: hypothetical protein K2X60_10350 [Xanthobacteraceae bacterium]|nr:hypothetical protein [Xanthobacteraceae bacterium]
MYHRLENRAVETERMKFRLAGLLGARAMTLQPIPNGEANSDIDGVWFAMTSSDGQIYRCCASRGFFQDHGVEKQTGQRAFFLEYEHSFYMAASAKYDMREFNGRVIKLGPHDIILMPNVLGLGSKIAPI